MIKESRWMLLVVAALLLTLTVPQAGSAAGRCFIFSNVSSWRR